MRRRAGSRALAAVLFTDIVDSSAVASRVGDARWKELIARHHAIVRRELKRFGGKELDTAGDGFFASFTEPAAAIRCACAASEAVRELGIEIRAGVHFGECEQVGEKLGGIAVVVGARVMSLGGAGDVLVTASTSDLVAGAGFGFQDRGTHALKGVDGRWHVLAVTGVDGEPRAQPAEPEEAEHRLAEVQPSSVLSRGWFASRPWAVGVGIALALALIAISIPLLRSGSGAVDVGTNSVARLNGNDGSLAFDPAALGHRPGASAIGFESLWVAEPDQGVVARVSLEDGSVTDPNIGVGNSPSGVAIGDGSVWVTNAGDGTVSRIDPGTGQTTQELPVGTTPTGIAFGDGALWIADTIGVRLLRLDPNSGEIRPVALAGEPSGVAFTPSGVWVSVAPAGIARVDPADPHLSVTLTYQAVGNGPTAVLSAFGSIWVANHLDGTVSRLNPSTGEPVDLIPVRDGSNALAASADLLWVANELDGSISAIDPHTSLVEPAIPVGGEAASLVTDGDGLWLSVGASPSEHIGGTLTVSSAVPAPTSLDPAGYDQTAWQILSMTNDGLLAYKKVGGPDGNTLVPDLASTLPEASPDGLTYRFPLREGIRRYSTGEPVRPEDFRYGLERSVALDRSLAGLYGAIVGVKACDLDPSTCDLSGGIVVDGRSVTFHLARPDPDLPFKLALPGAFPVPATVPVQDQGQTPIPATGPYMVADAGAGHIELVRNEQFHEWAPAAQPAGYVDAISWRFNEKLASAVDRLKAGDLDLMTEAPPPADLAWLQAAHPDQVVRWPSLATIYVGMDALRAPFNDVRVRQALNYALDRDHVVALFGGPTSQRPTCQIAPPNFPGYEPYCPYTRDPGSGTWSARDLDQARALIREAGAVGEKVSVLATDDPRGTLGSPSQRRDTMQYVVDVLDEIGLRADLKVAPTINQYWRSIYAGGGQAWLSGWITDIPRASDFIGTQFRCGTPFTIVGYVCAAGVEAKIEHAQQREATDPAAANRLWIEAEHELVDEAVVAPLTNPITTVAVSARVENLQVNPQWTILLSQVWVR